MFREKPHCLRLAQPPYLQLVQRLLPGQERKPRKMTLNFKANPTLVFNQASSVLSYGCVTMLRTGGMF